MKTLKNPMPLDDKVIRAELKSYLSSSNLSPKLIVDELLVHNGNARADIVAFYEGPYCFEIKSDRDTLARLKRQATFYDYTFRKNILVTTPKFGDRADSFIPEYWGILVAARLNTGKVKFVWKRRPKVNKSWTPDKALLTLWKRELQELYGTLQDNYPGKNISRDAIAKYLGEFSPKKELQHSFFEVLYKRCSGNCSTGYFQREESINAI